MPAVGLVVDFRYRLTRSGHYPASVELHACDGVVVGVGIMD